MAEAGEYSMVAAVVRMCHDGKLDLESLVRAAESRWWAWDAVNEIAPERLRVPRPKRRRGRDTIVNIVRDAEIGVLMTFMVSLWQSERKAAERLATYYPMLEAEAIRKIARRYRGNK